MRSCYDEGKRTAETLAMDYHRGAGVEVLLNCVLDVGNIVFDVCCNGLIIRR